MKTRNMTRNDTRTITRTSPYKAQVIASVLAGAFALTYGGGAGFVRLASAQTTPAKPATTAAPKPTKPATGAAAGDAADIKRARDAYAAGEQKFKAGDYEGALRDFQEADAIKSTPQAARYIALSHDNLGHAGDAVTAYERFLANVPPKMTKEGDEARKRVEELRAKPAKLSLETVPPGATVTIDGHALPQPTPTETELAPGKHVVSFSAEGYLPQEREVELTFASTASLRAELEKKEEPPPPPPIAEAPPPAPAPEPPPAPPVAESRSMAPAWITGGLAVVAAGVGTVFGLQALSDQKEFDRNPTSSRADDGENNALIADMAFGVAITLGVTSAVLFLSSDPAPTTAKAPVVRSTAKSGAKRMTITPTPFVTRDGGGAGAVVRF